MKAKFEEWCSLGKDRIFIDEDISKFKGQWYHTDCIEWFLDTAEIQEILPKLCPVCFIHHNGECA